MDDLGRLKLTEDEMQRLRAINAVREQARNERVARVHKEQETLLRDLRAVGLSIQYVSDLINTGERYEKGIPVLLRHLLYPYSDITRETIARCLAVPEPEVQQAWRTLVNEYCRAPIGKGIADPDGTEVLPLGAKDGLACALAAAVTADTLEELISIAKDRAHGESRVLLLYPIRKSRSAAATRAIEELSKDPDLMIEIASWRTRRRG